MEELKKPKILIFTVTSWNSKVGANTWETLVSNYGKEQLASIFLRDETPDSNVCSRYFCISENQILRSIIKRKTKTGKEVFRSSEGENEESDDLAIHNERYRRMKKKRRYSMLLARELLWKIGRWKTKELDDFLDDFKPDIILHSMEGYIHLNRIVRYAIRRTGARAIGYIWDDNFTYKQSRKLGYKMYRFFQRRSLKKLARDTAAFFAITPKTKEEADKFFKINSTVISKPLVLDPIADKYEGVGFPLKMLYTGNLLIGRDKTLVEISSALNEFNSDEVRLTLDVFTQTALEDGIKESIESEFCRLHSPIGQSEVIKKQQEADVLLFLEDMSDRNLTARLSFSTKITDYFSAGKCILAVGNPDLAPMQYFTDTDSALVAHDREQIRVALSTLLNTSELERYAGNAVNCGIKNHNSKKITRIFDEAIRQVYEGEQ